MKNNIKVNFIMLNKMISAKKGLLASFFSILIGIIFGSYIYNFPDFSLKNKMLSFFVLFNTEITDKTYIEIFSGFFLNEFIYFVMIFFCAGNIFGKELSMLVTAVKASGIGTLIAFFYDYYGIEGLEYTLLVFMPGKLLLFFAMLFLTECCFNASDRLRSGINSADARTLIKVLSLKSSVASGIMLLSLIVDLICLIGFSELISFA